MGLILTRGLLHATKLFKDWFKGGYKYHPILRIGGVAGTGKTTFISYLYNSCGLNSMNTALMAFTGRAVNVLREKELPARTCHATLYHTAEVELYDSNGDKILKRGVPITKLKSIPIGRLPNGIKLLIIDEASFIPDFIIDTAMKHRLPILLVGDPEQLPPVTGKQIFTNDTIDYLLTEPMRHNEDNMIYKFANDIRAGNKINYSSYMHNFQVVFLKNKGNLVNQFNHNKRFFLDADICITATNKDRQTINDTFRREIIKTDNPFPNKGETLICRNNNWNLKVEDYSLINGTIGKCVHKVSRSNIHMKDGMFLLDFKPDYVKSDEYFENLICDINFLQMPVYDTDKKISTFKNYNKLEYAYAITTHLSQGSQYQKVLFVDRGDINNYNNDYMRRLRYTAITRARSILYYVVS